MCKSRPTPLCRFLSLMLWASLSCAGCAGEVHGGNLLGVEAVPDPLPYEVDAEQPVSMLLSRSRYPAEDGHLDAILWLNPEGEAPPEGRLALTLSDEGGRQIWREEITPIPGRRVFLSPRFPDELAGRGGVLSAEWFQGGRLLGAARGEFLVNAPEAPPASGRVAIAVPNETGVHARAVPFTVGVPFPRGALREAANLRLVNEQGREMPLQVKETAKWSRFGSVKWALCDFAADLDGGPRRFYLEYGPDVRRGVTEGLDAGEGEGFPALETGRLRFGEGVWLLGDDGAWHKVLGEAALSGGYVVHEDGREFRMDPQGEYVLEEDGPEKVVVLRRGWFVEPATGDEFCQYATRFVVHRGSPLVRVFFTWIFTGDAYADRVRDIGWRFPAQGMQPLGFLSAFGDEGQWVQGDYQLQHDYDKYEVSAGGEAAHEGARAPGVMAASVGETRIMLGVRDFWQNFPHELGFADGGMVYHLWPRHGKPVRHPYDALDLRDAQRLWFAHEGEVLDFAMPEEYFTRPEFLASMIRHNLGEGRFRKSVNAQGVAKTAELWLHFSEEAAPPNQAAALMEGLQTRSVRAVADPAWVCASGAFYEAHPYDPENFPEEEAVFALHASAPAVWAERIHYYGKWIWGDMNWQPNLRDRYGVVYRGFRKAHQGWPYSWLPYARSGEPAYMAFADAATRYMADVVFCHYADERAVIYDAQGRTSPRPRGFNIRFSIPWANHRFWIGPTNRDYIDKCNYLWHSYYLTGYHRAKDVALDWGYLTQHEPSGRFDIFGPGAGDWSRNSVTILQSYVEMYEAVFEPWFLAAAHQVARQQMRAFRDDGWQSQFWNPGPREFLRFTGCPEFEELYLAYARKWADTEADFSHYTHSYPMMEPAAFGWLKSGDEFYLRRLRAMLDEMRAWTFDGEHGYYMGARVSGGVHGAMPQYTAYLLQHYPHALHALAKARDARGVAEDPPPLHKKFFQLPAFQAAEEREGGDGWGMPHPPIRVLKAAGEPLPLRFAVSRFARHSHGDFPWEVQIVAPDGRAILDARWKADHSLEGEVPNWGEAGDLLLGSSGRPAGDGGPIGVLQAVVPAEAPAGAYELRVLGHSRTALTTRPRILPGMYLPVSADERPEVMGLDAENRVGPALRASRYAFAVPEGRDELVFRCDFRGLRTRDEDCPLLRATVWNHRGERVAVAEADRNDLRGTELVLRAPVAEGDAGQIWEIAVAFPHSGVQFDPAIVPWVSTQRGRWFNPEGEGRGARR